ncbi:disease resistance protein RFL1-like [Brassica napus]|uniref:disease resistance protein RFL1-like n=1 Tax=Brassica napus TaxID=3708 RepID=UPI00207AA2B0|nr:disease resistance protein RFL1-like [Brassica napus]
MGGCFSVSLSCDQVVNQVFRCLCLKGSYVHNLPQNLASLEKAMGTLTAKRDDVQGRVDREEFTGHRRRLAQVQVWLTSILTMENQYNELLNTRDVELQRLCLCRFCSKNVKKSYLYGKRVMVMLREVESLIRQQREFDEVTDATPIAEGEELPIQPTIGQETMLEMVWNRLMEDEVGIVGLYGMGGVGKTTLLTQINNRFSKRGGGFDVVIWVVVSQNATVHKIQGSIGEKLGLLGKEWDEKSEMKRGQDIHNVLRKKKFVLLLDDIWEKVNLSTIGVPYPSKVNGSKVAFTTRSRDVCGRMEVDDPIEVRCLDTDKAWDLFKKKVGENTLGSHPGIPELAREVAGKCRGLPLALNVIGGTMASKRSLQEWRLAVDVLTSSAREFSGVEDEILQILKYSYDSLDGEMTKSCFLYCSLFPEDDIIDKEELIEYWIGEGFIDEKEGREMAMNKGYEILETLVRACLLLEDDEDESEVTMHDVVREMAMWIASDLGKNKEKCIVQARAGIREIPKVKNWKDVRRISLMENDIQIISESPECPQLTTLLLQRNNKLVEISDGFFQSMPKLLVLDLSLNRLSGFRMDVSNLVSLRYLNLSDTSISECFGLERLKMLTHLNLEGTSSLESLEGISGLSSLRTLKLLHSKVRLDMSLMKELQLLQHIEYISVSISSCTLVGEKLFDDPRMGRCIQHVCIIELILERVKVIVLPALDGLRDISIYGCEMLEEIKIEKTPWNKSLTSPCFSNLTTVQIRYCNGLKDLTWLLFAPNLTLLDVHMSRRLEEIISKEKAESVLENNIIPFQKLEELSLMMLPQLKSIYWNALPFQRLRWLHIRKGCPKLRKLPLNSESVVNVEKLVIGCDDKEWLERVEWEDEATRLRFLPSCKEA